ncbi:DUF2059 domain-containing protein [Saccharophagus degradans]|uniref:DUF2059 domain-containing protein n=1 Tax=Saccharophagus degradans TaxID=86304 RepID=A0AAW7XDG9_9GAMM|nr:DUF2059 domain-containing protein [Saccharophagus degradans]MDO6424897.1 DUF2059 domain-containing protein [Saccharophagus degradans]MDO6607603.1 DUF2059 domain-containing protein [Saccharophagus degradans]
MKKLLALTLLVCSFGMTSAHAADEAKIKELIKMMDMDSIVEQMYSQMEGMMKNMSTELGVKPSEQALFDTYYEKMMGVMREEMSWKKMEPMIVDIYAKNFSDKEVSDMLAFYKTETGQSLIKKMPAVMQESMQMSQGFAQSAIPRIQAIAKELHADLAASREAASKAE